MAKTRTRLDRKENILEAAAALFERNGFASTTVDQIGAAVGITGPAIYRYYPGKEALLAGIVQACEELTASLTTAGTEAAGPVVRLNALRDGLVDSIMRAPSLTGLVLGGHRLREPDADRRLAKLRAPQVKVWVAAHGAVATAMGAHEAHVRVRSAFAAALSVLNQPSYLDEDVLRGELASLVDSALLGHRP